MIKVIKKGLRFSNKSISGLSAKMSIASTNHRNGGFAAIVQLTSTSDKTSNFTRAKTLIENAVLNHKAKVVFLPEAFDFIAESTSQTLQLSESIDGPLISQYKSLAQDLNVSLSLGGFQEASSDISTQAIHKIKNTHLFINGEDGEIVAKYSKTHLFDVEIPDQGVRLKESDYVKGGNNICSPISTDIGRIGLGICYDLRFPEISLAMARQNSSFGSADILTYPSAFTVPTGSAHWEVLLRARAIENQCYVIAAAQSGAHNKKISSYGHSMIIDPWGSVIAQCSEGEGVASAYIDLGYLEKVRKSMPVWSHRRRDMYGLVVDDETQVPNVSESALNTQVTSNIKDQYFGSFTIPKEEIVLVSRYSYATVNIKPVVPYHMLVMPKAEGIHKLSDLSCEETADLFNLVKKVQSLVEQFRGVKSSTIAIQDGEDAGQTVKHVHVHVLPRVKNDFEQNDDIYTELAKHDHQPGKKPRTHEEMKKEAHLLRKYLLDNRDNL